MKTAVVLSGGGAKGAYQIGVWKALKKLKIHYDIITGTSVGALNGVMMVQNDYHIAKKIWSNINYNTIFNDNFKNVDKNIYLTYIKQFVSDGGMEIINLETLLNKVYNAKKFYKSEVDFGIVVYNVTDKKEELLTKETIDPQNLKDYVIASSSCYPAFKTKKINGSKYIDGGYYDNLPINLAIDLGANKIIAVDLKAPGIKQKQKNKDIDLVVIYPRNYIGSFLEFNKELARKSICYGYNDTMKIFNKLDGNIYTFYNRFFCSTTKKEFVKYKQRINKTIDKYSLKDILNRDIAYDEFLETIEYAGEIFNIENHKKYYVQHYNHRITKKFQQILRTNEKSGENNIFKKAAKGLLEPKYIVKYIYQIIINNCKVKELKILATMFKKEFLVAVYLITLNS